VVTLVVSASLTALGAWDAFADHRWKWIRYRATLSMLYTLQEDLDYRQASKTQLSADEIDQYFQQLKQTVHETSQEWMSQRGNVISSGGSGEKGSAR
jgi:hypothetical protein